MGKRVGFFGGTFDPPHQGHALLAQNAYHQAQLDDLLWVLTPLSPFKNYTHARLQQRIEMVELMVGSQSFSRLSRVEINRQPPYYTLETAEIIRNSLNKEDELFFVMGGDSLRYFPKWHGAGKLLHQVLNGLIVARRPGDDLDLSRTERSLPGILEKITFIDMKKLDIASSEIRTKIQRGYSVDNDLIPEVKEYIQKKHLYEKPYYLEESES